MHSVRIAPMCLDLTGTMTTRQTSGDAGCVVKTTSQVLRYCSKNTESAARIDVSCTGSRRVCMYVRVRVFW